MCFWAFDPSAIRSRVSRITRPVSREGGRRTLCSQPGQDKRVCHIGPDIWSSAFDGGLHGLRVAIPTGLRQRGGIDFPTLHDERAI